MYPILFEHNGFVISSYGLMLMIAFVLCNYLLKRYLISINVNGEIADDLIFYAAFGGIIGAKVYYIIEGIPSGDAYENIQGLFMIVKGVITFSFSTIATGVKQFGSGLVYLGGLIGGMLSVTFYIRKNNLNWFEVSDWVAPYLALGHCIGRIGCFLVGCCYGTVCNHSWGVQFPNGIPPSTYESFKYMYPENFQQSVEPFFSQGSLLHVHPTQLYESVLYFLLFACLVFFRNRKNTKGFLMLNYLLFAGIIRFCIEFLRLNPKYILNLSSAQLVSFFMVSISIILLYRMKNNSLLGINEPNH